MQCGRKKILSFLGTRWNEDEKALPFMDKNGSTLHEELITTFNGRHKVPIGIFTAPELTEATNDFSNPIGNNAYQMMFFRGSSEQHDMVVWEKSGDYHHARIHNIVMTSQMSHHKNVWKLLGCCLEFEVPALVYEYDMGCEFLDNLLFNSYDDESRKLSLNSRLSIANDIANVIVYLHTAFPTPVIFRLLGPYNIIVDKSGVAKLFNFSRSIWLPPGKLKIVEECVTGFGGLIAPEYFSSGIVSQKTDVFAFGVLLVVLLSGKMIIDMAEVEEEFQDLFIHGIVDDVLMEEGEGTEQEQQILSLKQLALKCVRHDCKDRPEMIDVARELRQIKRLVHPH